MGIADKLLSGTIVNKKADPQIPDITITNEILKWQVTMFENFLIVIYFITLKIGNGDKTLNINRMVRFN